MRARTADHFDRWIRGAGILACVTLAWAVFLPDGALLWTAVLAVGLIGSAVATAILVRSRGVPSLAPVIASAEGDPVAVPAGRGCTIGAGLRLTRGEREP